MDLILGHTNVRKRKQQNSYSAQMLRLPILVVLFALLLQTMSFGQNLLQKNEYTFMFYNLENFFDTDNDPLVNDDEFTPDGNRRWNIGRMHSKAERIGKVILAAGNWNPPVFVGLCEIENYQALELLTNIAPLKKYDYKIIHKDSPDERGIDVAFIYRSDLFRPIDYQAITVTDSAILSYKTRDILRVSGIINGCDTVHVFVNHWPSRFGGVKETIRYRELAAKTLLEAIRKLNLQYRQAKIICTGDFNDTPDDDSLSKIFGAQKFNSPEKSGEMINLSTGWNEKPIKTIKSKYSWEIFDQWLVSDYFLDENDCYSFSEATIFDQDFVLEPDMKYGGVKPARTYIGYRYQDGFSDHLPILLRFQLKD